MPPCSPLPQKALERLRGNIRSGHDPYYKMEFAYVRPSPGRYEFMWFWDSCFHAIAAARLDPDMARRELRQLAATQRSDGFIGHVVYWGRWGALQSALFMQGRLGEWRRRHSAMIQPPMLAQALEAVHVASPDAAFLAEMLPKAQAYYDWLARERDFDGSGLVFIISPWESGLDNSPAYDEPLGLRNPGRASYLARLRFLDWHNLLLGKGFNSRELLRRNRFVVVDPLVNAIYGDGLRSLSRLYEAAGDQTTAQAAVAWAAKVEAALDRDCWDPERGHWIYLWTSERRPVTVLTAGSMMPVIMEGISRQHASEAVSRHLVNPGEFWTWLPVPSVAASEPAYDPEGERMIWRGPVCLNLNWFFVRGLRRNGFFKEADHIAARSREAAGKSGFREFYSPDTGRGMRGMDFGWATVAAAMDP
jgi:glycogen debranching enzyme